VTDQQSRVRPTTAGRAGRRLGDPGSPTEAGLFRRLWGLRIVRFGAVAAVCTLLQLVVLAGLARLGTNQVLANGIGFGLSAQVSFVLSTRITWRDRQARAAGWAAFNAIAVAALVVNELVFATAPHSGRLLIAASLAGVVSGAVITFTLNNVVTFRGRRSAPPAQAQAERRPPLGEIRTRAQRDGVAFFLPAFNEAANLRTIVPGIVAYFLRLACPFTVIIVDDGSTGDDTFGAAEDLALAYPGHVRAVHHPANQGYGAALQTGIRAALGTGHGLIGFCDADGQFDIASFGTLVAALQDQEADLAAGYRIARADSLKRRLMGRGWHWLSSRVLGFTAARDVDCGFKVFTAAVLRDIEPQVSGGYAATSPEILARAVSAGYTLTEAGVTHQPRGYGRQTGSDLKVVVGSLAYLFQLRLTLRKERRHDPRHPAAAVTS
jgi:putative flippase GtrA